MRAQGGLETGFILVSHDGGTTFGPRRPMPSGFGTMVAAASTSTIVLASGNVFGGGPFTYMVWTSTNGGVAWRTVVRDRETLTSSTPGQSYLALSLRLWPTGLGSGTSSGRRPTLACTGRPAMSEIPVVGKLVLVGTVAMALMLAASPNMVSSTPRTSTTAAQAQDVDSVYFLNPRVGWASVG